jgi:hypothetical protein
MPKERLSIVKIKEVLRLKFAAGLSNRQIAASCGASHSTIGQYLRRAEEAGIGWPLPEEMSQRELEQRLFAQPQRIAGDTLPRVMPDWAAVHQQMKRKGVTLMLLWQEYKEQHPETGYQYSQFNHHYRQWLGSVDVVMRQTHRAGEKLFVDYAGQTAPVIERHSGEVRQAEIFVAVLGASQYTYAEATWTQQSADWIASHIRALNFFDGCTEVLVPDDVPGNIIGVMCPPPLCGVRAAFTGFSWRRPNAWEHNDYSERSHLSSDSSSRHTGFRGNPAEASTGGAHASSACAFI